MSLVACTLVRVYDMKDFNKQVKKNIKKMEKSLASVSKDLSFLNSVSKKLDEHKTENFVKPEMLQLAKYKQQAKNEMNDYKKFSCVG